MAKESQDEKTQLAAEVRNKYRELKAESQERLGIIEKNEKWFEGQESVQWTKDRPLYKPRTMANLLESNCRTKISLLTDSKPRFYIYGIPELKMLDAVEKILQWNNQGQVPVAPGMPGMTQPPQGQDVEAAQALMDLAKNMNIGLDHIWRYNRMHMTLEHIIMLGSITGLLSGRVYWDREANRRGEIKIEPVNSKYLFFDKTVSRVDVEDGTCGWFICNIPKPISWFNRYFPGNKVKPIETDEVTGEKKTVPTGEYIEAYTYDPSFEDFEDEDGKKGRRQKYSRAVRLVIMGGNEVLWYGEAPFFNYVCTPYEFKPGDYFGEGDVRKQIRLNEDFNSKLAQVSLNIALSANRQYVVNPAKLGLKIDELLEHANEPGYVFQTIKLAEDVKNAIIALDSPTFTPELFNYLFYIPQLMEQVSGILKSVQGMPQKKERQTKYEIGKQYEAATVRIRNTAHHVESFLTDMVYTLIKAIKVYYNKPRKIFSVDEERGEQKVANFQYPEEAQDFDFIVTVQPESMLPIDSQSQAERDMQLFQMGALDPQTLLETLHHPKVADVMQRVQQMMAAKAQGQSPQGNTGVPLP